MANYKRRLQRELPAPAAMPLPASTALGQRIAPVILFFHLGLSPLVFTTSTLEVFEYPKTSLLLLAAIVLGALGLSAVVRHIALAQAGNWRDWLRGQAAALGRDPLVLGFVCFFFSAVLSTAGSLCPRLSFWGAYDTYGGLCTIAAYTVLFFATRAFCSKPADARRLLLASVLAAGVSATYGVLQFARLDPLAWTDVSSVGALIEDSYVRPFGTMGHANFLSAFLVMTLPLTGLFALRCLRNRNWLGLFAFTAIAGLSLLAILLSLSRGAWLALAGTAAVLVACSWRRVRWRQLQLPCHVAIIVLAFVPLFVPWAEKNFFPNLVERLRHLTDVGSRLSIWRAALAIFRDYPVLGCGLDTFQLAFGPNRPASYWHLEWNVTPARAHNEALHILATQGLLGATALLILLMGLVLAGCRAWQQTGPENKPLVLALLAGTAGFLIQDAVSLTVAGCGTLFVTFAALLSGLGQWAAGGESRPCSPHRPALCLAIGGRLLQSALWAGAGVLLMVGVVRPFQTNWICCQGDRQRGDDPEGAVATISKAVEHEPGNELYWTKLAGAAQQAARASNNAEEHHSLLLLARSALERACQLVPINAYNHANLGQLLGKLAQEHQATSTEAFAEYDVAFALDPRNGTLYADAAMTGLAIGDLPRARAYAERGTELYPHFGRTLSQLGYLAMLERRWDDAIRILSAAYQSPWPDHFEEATACLANMAVTQMHRGDFLSAVNCFHIVLERGPQLTEIRCHLARSLETLGRREEAVAEYRRVLECTPGHGAAKAELSRLGAARETATH
jgi:O-antigen ligase/tetratricopeptide (TPR) repeat protein